MYVHTQRAMSDVKMMLIANKSDISESRRVTEYRGKQVCMSYFTCYCAPFKGKFQHQISICILRVECFTCKTKFSHAYRLNRLEEQVENRYIARFSIQGMSYGGYK